MALPAEFNTITVVMDYVDLTGAVAPAGSKVEFSPSSDTFLKASSSDVVIYPGTITATLTTGHGSVVLPFSNDPDITPTFTYKVKETLGTTTRTYNVEIPVSLAPGPINLSDLAPIGATVVGSNLLTRGVADALYAPIGSVGGGTGSIADGAVTTAKVADGAITIAKITGLTEEIQDRVAGTLVEGANVDIAYNDTTGVITVSATGGTAETTTFDPYGDVAATDVQGALETLNDLINSTASTASSDKRYQDPTTGWPVRGEVAAGVRITWVGWDVVPHTPGYAIAGYDYQWSVSAP